MNNKISLILGILISIVIVVSIIFIVHKKTESKYKIKNNSTNQNTLLDNEFKGYLNDKHYIIELQAQKDGPFCVYVNKNYVDIYIIPKNIKKKYSTNKDDFTEQIASFKPKTIFIDDTILIELPNNEYVYISHSIYKFTSKSKIVYLSPSGDKAGVDYAFALDDKKNIYLLLDFIILEKYNIDGYEDPYNYYYTLYSNLDMDIKKKNKTKAEIEKIEKLKEEKKNTIISYLKHDVLVY
jgi:hypothetical protein